MIAGCHRTSPIPTTEANSDKVSLGEEISVSGATISASPNPILHGPEEGTTTITRDTHANGAGRVEVSRNGAPKQLLSHKHTGSQTVKWIRTGLSYEFDLYQTPSHKLLSKVNVLHQR